MSQIYIHGMWASPVSLELQVVLVVKQERVEFRCCVYLTFEDL